jgi:hypothetical protein
MCAPPKDHPCPPLAPPVSSTAMATSPTAQPALAQPPDALVPIPTKPPVCNGMIAPRDSWMMPPPCNEMIAPGAPRLLA